MRIDLTQHGQAAPEDVDPDRPLTVQGREDVRRLADSLDKAGIQSVMLATSLAPEGYLAL